MAKGEQTIARSYTFAPSQLADGSSDNQYSKASSSDGSDMSEEKDVVDDGL